MENLITDPREPSPSSSSNYDHEQELPHLRKKTKPKKMMKEHPLIVNLSGMMLEYCLECKYVVVKNVVKGLKFNVVSKGNMRDSMSENGGSKQCEWDLMWTDNAVTPEILSKMKNYQKINHFPGMFHLSRKNYLARNLNKMQKEFPENYDFYPKTWTLPAEYNELKQYLENEHNPVVIAKPEASCQGRGIFLTKNIEEFEFGEHYVVQKYIKRPFLIEGLKFDLRVYVLVSGCEPLRAHIYREGLARFATEVYVSPKKDNLNNLFMHLTNYAINKANTKFEFNSSSEHMDIGHKRSLTSILSKLKELGHNESKIWEDICLMISKTLISVQPILSHTYRSCQPDNLANNMCFEILGFDIMLDHELKPIILEVNYTPSFTVDTPLDLCIKENLIRDTLVLMNINNKTKNEAVNDKKREILERTLTGKKVWKGKEEREKEIERLNEKRNRWEDKHMGNFQKIYPIEQQKEQLTQLFDKFLSHSQACYHSGTGASTPSFYLRHNPSYKTKHDSSSNSNFLALDSFFASFDSKTEQS